VISHNRLEEGHHDDREWPSPLSALFFHTATPLRPQPTPGSDQPLRLELSLPRRPAPTCRRAVPPYRPRRNRPSQGGSTAQRSSRYEPPPRPTAPREHGQHHPVFTSGAITGGRPIGIRSRIIRRSCPDNRSAKNFEGGHMWSSGHGTG
jgi:hypothetical protein